MGDRPKLKGALFGSRAGVAFVGGWTGIAFLGGAMSIRGGTLVLTATAFAPGCGDFTITTAFGRTLQPSGGGFIGGSIAFGGATFAKGAAGAAFTLGTT